MGATLKTIANVADLSPYHFSRQFFARYGLPPMAQVRELRMIAAATQLVDGTASSLVDLASSCGFERQEGFTRAFKRTFGVSPGRYRRAQGSQNGENSDPNRQTIPGLTVVPELQRKPAFAIAGFGRRFEETGRDQIPALWGRLTPRLPFAGQVGNATYGVCWEADDGAFYYMAGVALAAGVPKPRGVDVRNLPAQEYLVYRLRLRGLPLVPQLQEAAREIWGERIPRSGYTLARGPDVEFYPDDFRPNQPGKFIEWWIPVNG